MLAGPHEGRDGPGGGAGVGGDPGGQGHGLLQGGALGADAQGEARSAASRALIQSEVNRMRAACCHPIRAGKSTLLAASAGTPSSAKGTRRRRRVDQDQVAVGQHGEAQADRHPVHRRQHRHRKLGEGVSSPMNPCPAPSTAVPVAMAAISARSWPEVKAVPRPVRTTALTAGRRRPRPAPR